MTLLGSFKSDGLHAPFLVQRASAQYYGIRGGICPVSYTRQLRAMVKFGVCHGDQLMLTTSYAHRCKQILIRFENLRCIAKGSSREDCTLMATRIGRRFKRVRPSGEPSEKGLGGLFSRFQDPAGDPVSGLRSALSRLQQRCVDESLPVYG